MSMHKVPLTKIEEDGLRAHGLDIGVPSQLSDVFRQGVKWAQQNAQIEQPIGEVIHVHAHGSTVELMEHGMGQVKVGMQVYAAPAALTVWEGSMPESNGKSNFTAILMRKGGTLFNSLADGFTIARSEYPDRVRYEADCVRWLIGELKEQPCITDYDADKHSGYVPPEKSNG